MEHTEMTANGHQWFGTVALRVILALVALLSLVLASGAGSQWF